MNLFSGFQLQLSEQIGAINLRRILWLQLTAIFLHGSRTVRRRILKDFGVRVCELDVTREYVYVLRVWMILCALRS